MVWVDCGDDDDDRTAGVCQKHTAHVYDFGLWQKKDGEMQLQFLNDENIKKSSCLSDFTNFGYSNVFKSKKEEDQSVELGDFQTLYISVHVCDTCIQCAFLCEKT